MSWDISMYDHDGELAPVTPFMGGGTVMANPDTMEEIPQVQAEFNVTYNYSLLFDLAAKAALYELGRDGYLIPSLARAMLERWYQDGFRSLDDHCGWQVTDGLHLLIDQLDPGARRGGRRSWKHEDYWAPTPGNAVAALRTILAWCEQHPGGKLTAH